MPINYLNLSYEDKTAKISTLQLMRVDVLKASVKKRRAKPKGERKRKMVFFSDEIEKMFKSMPESMQKFIRNGDK